MLFLVTPPSSQPVSLAEAKAHLRIDDGVTEFNHQITGYINAATRSLENSIGYGLVTQTWREAFANFWCPIRLTMRPVSEAPAVITYRDADNADQIFDAGFYTVFGDLVYFASGTAFPTLYSRPDAVLVEYEVGVPAGEVPEDLKAAILLHVGFLFEARESHAEKPWRPTGEYHSLTFPYCRIYV